MLGLQRVALAMVALAQFSDAAPQVSVSIQQWEKRTNIDVGDFSEARLRTELPRIVEQMQLPTPQGVGGTGSTKYEQFVLGAVTRDFLYWSRDQAGGNVTRLGEPTVDQARFAAYISQHRNLQGREVAELHVTSDPSLGVISIDGANKGKTESSLVVSVGRHQLVITPPGRAACNRSIDVTAGETKDVNCP